MPLRLAVDVPHSLQPLLTLHPPAFLFPIADPIALFSYLIPEIDKLQPLFIHMVEPRLDANNEVVPYDEARASNKTFRKLFSRAYIAAGG